MRRLFSAEALCVVLVVTACVMGWRSFASDRVYRLYYPSGAVEREYHFDSEGRRHGPYLEFFEDGSIRQESEFAHGVWVRVTHFYPNGQKAYELISGSPDIVRDWLEDGTEVTPPPR